MVTWTLAGRRSLTRVLLVGRVCEVDWVGARVADDPIAEVTLAARRSGKWEKVMDMFGGSWPCTMPWAAGLDLGSGVSGLGLVKVDGRRPGDVAPF